MTTGTPALLLRGRVGNCTPIHRRAIRGQRRCIAAQPAVTRPTPRAGVCTHTHTHTLTHTHTHTHTHTLGLGRAAAGWNSFCAQHTALYKLVGGARVGAAGTRWERARKQARLPVKMGWRYDRQAPGSRGGAVGRARRGREAARLRAAAGAGYEGGARSRASGRILSSRPRSCCPSPSSRPSTSSYTRRSGASRRWSTTGTGAT